MRHPPHYRRKGAKRVGINDPPMCTTIIGERNPVVVEADNRFRHSDGLDSCCPTCGFHKHASWCKDKREETLAAELLAFGAEPEEEPSALESFEKLSERWAQPQFPWVPIESPWGHPTWQHPSGVTVEHLERRPIWTFANQERVGERPTAGSACAAALADVPKGADRPGWSRSQVHELVFTPGTASVAFLWESKSCGLAALVRGERREFPGCDLLTVQVVVERAYRVAP